MGTSNTADLGRHNRAMSERVNRLECMDLKAWRAYTKREMRDYLDRVYLQAGGKGAGNAPFKSFLVVRRHLSPVDVYCYLKARFGEPNGLQNFLRKDDSDNWIQWDFNLRVANEDVYVTYPLDTPSYNRSSAVQSANHSLTIDKGQTDPRMPSIPSPGFG